MSPDQKFSSGQDGKECHLREKSITNKLQLIYQFPLCTFLANWAVFESTSKTSSLKVDINSMLFFTERAIIQFHTI